MSEPLTTTDETTARFYTVKEAAEILNVSIPTLRKAIDSGQIPSVTVGEKTVRIPKQAIDRIASGVAS